MTKKVITGKALKKAVISSKRKQKEVAEAMGITYSRLWQLYHDPYVEEQHIENAINAGIVFDGMPGAGVTQRDLVSLLHKATEDAQEWRRQAMHWKSEAESLQKKLATLQKKRP